jgi:hypothetical protein
MILVAYGKVDSVTIDERAASEARWIELVHRHVWAVPVYSSFLLIVWFRLSLRNVRKILVFASLLLLSVPLLLYDRAWLRIENMLVSTESVQEGTGPTTQAIRNTRSRQDIRQ